MKRFLALSLVLTVILMACTLTACSLFGGNDTASPCKNGHTWEDHEDLGEATCTMSGSVFKKCSVCGVKQEFTTPPIGHELKDKNVYVAPTCTEEGYKGTAICTRSGCDYVDNLEIIPVVDHKYGKWTSVGDGTHKRVCSYDSKHVEIVECSGGTATCSSQATCKTCGGKYGELGTEHKFNKKIATEEYLNTEATCIELATYFYSCECGEIGYEIFEYGDLADHDYVDGFCSVCGEADPTASISLEGTYTATDDWNNSFAVVVTADTITFTPPMSNEVVYTYEYNDGMVTIYDNGVEVTIAMQMSLTVVDGVITGMTYNGTGYTITVGGAGEEEPEQPEVLPGTFVVEDNNMGVLTGTYGYTIDEYNAVIVTKDGEVCSDFMFSIDMGGYWMVQCAGTGPMAQYLCDEEGNYVTELAGTLNVNYFMNGLYVYTFPASEGGEEEPEEGGNGTEANPYVVDDMPSSITFESDTFNKVYYVFTASQTGAITFTWPNADSWYGITELDANGDNTGNSTSGYMTTSFSFDVVEGTKYKVELGTWNNAGEVTITVAYGESGEEEPDLNAFFGYFEDENGNSIYIYEESEIIWLDKGGLSYRPTLDGSALIFNAIDDCAYDAADNTNRADFTVVISENGIIVSHDCRIGLDMDGFVEFDTISVEYAFISENKPTISTIEEALIGTWSTASGNTIVITETTITINGTEVTNLVIEEDSWAPGYMLYVFNVGTDEFQIYWGDEDYDGTIDTPYYGSTSSWEADAMTPYTGEEPEDPELDAFAGSWTKEDATNNHYQYTLTFDGAGNVSIYSAKYDTTYTAEYTVNDKVATFYANWADWTCTLNEDGTLQVIDMDMDSACTVNCAMDKVANGGEEPEEPEQPEQPEVITTIAGALAGSEGASASLSGTVSEIYQAWNDYYGNMSFYLSDGTNRIIVFRAETQVGIGDEVTVEGTITIYQQTGVAQIAAGATVTITAQHVCSTFTDADCYNAAVCTVCGKVNGEALEHKDENSDGLCDNCGTDMESTASEITASKTIAELVTENGWTTSTTKQSFNLDDVVSVKVGGGSNSGKAYPDHIRIYATDTPAGSLTITLAEGYELVSVKVSAKTGTYAFLCVGDSTADISNVSTVVSGSSVVLNTVKNGSDGKQVQITAMEVVYKAIGGGSEEPEECAHEYDNNCDADCNLCGETRIPADHEYDNACDADCNVCSATREVGDHVGGIATCIALAVCTECGAEYGELGDHVGGTATCVDLAVCTECGEEYGELVAHDTTFHEEVASTCVVYGNVEYWACSTCGKNFASQEGGEEIPNVTRDFDPNNHENLVTVDAVPATHQSTGLTEGQRCLDCGIYTIPQTVTDKLPCVDENEDEVCDVCGSSLTCVHANFTYSVNTEDNTKHDKVCGICGGVVETTAHVYVQTDYLAPDCDDAGTTEYTCSEYCGHVKNEDIEATGHSTTDLSYTYKDETTHNVVCNVCNEEIDVADHAEFSYVVNADDATKHDKVCGLCNGVVATSEHNYEATGYTSPDCDDAGSIEYTCSDCGNVKSEEVPATGHSETEFNYSLNTEDNTKHNVLCGICGEVVGTEDHTYEEVDRVAATCVDEGLVEYDCTACGHDYLEELPVDETAHSTTEFTYELNTEDNTKHNVLCGLCGDVIETVDHTYEEVDRIAATCVDEGLVEYDCTACGHDYLEELPVDENAHVWNEGEVTTPATCTQAGEKTFTCTLDSTHTTKTEPIEKADHNYVDGTCTNCPAINRMETVATFEFGDNGSAGHSDGNTTAINQYTEKSGDYTITFSNLANVYSGARDAKGNSALKLGSSSKAGTFTFTVPSDVTKVIINVAQRNAKATSVTVNSVTYKISTASDNGEYTAIEIDTTSVKTISFASGASDDKRCMINNIKFEKAVVCEHENATVKETIAPTCTEQGYTVYTCTCGEYKWDYTDATGHTMTYVAAVASTCKTEGNIEHWACSVCEKNYDAEENGNVIDNEKLPLDEDNHENIVTLDAEPADCQNTGLTAGKKCDACGVVTEEQTVTEKGPCVDGDDEDELCDVCGNSTSCAHDWGEWSEDDDDNHSRICTLCLGVETEEHTYGNWTVNTENSDYHDHTCSVCNHTETATHNTADVSYVNDPVENWHNVICNDCGGVTDYEEHTTPTYEVNATDNTKHDVKCDKCGVIGTEDHTVGYKNNDGSTHDTYCTVCNYNIATGVAHVDNGTGSCDCGKAIQEEKVEYKHQFTAKQYTANGAVTLSGEKWTLAGDGGYWGYDGTKGQQFGSGSKPYKTLTLTSEKSFNKVSYIHINTSGASSINGTLKVYVGDTLVETITLTATATEYNIEDINNLNGAVKFEYTQTSSKAIYIKSIAVTYVA